MVTEALWKKVTEDFSNDKAHQAFLGHCSDADRLSDAASRYAAMKKALNEDQVDERKAIDKRLAAIAILAMNQLETRRTPPATRGRRVLAIVAALLAVGSVIGMALLAM